MKKIKMRTKYTYDHTKSEMEINLDPSLTVEGEAHTIRELFQRSAGQLADSIYRHEIPSLGEASHDDHDLEKVLQADMVEKDESLSEALKMDKEEYIKKKAKATKPKEAKPEKNEDPPKKENPPKEE